MPQHELLAGVADVELDARLRIPPVVDALQEVVEEALLEREAVGAGEERPVRVSVDLEPLLRGRGLREAVEVAARMDALAAPVGARQQGRRHQRQIGRALAVPLVVERMLLELLEDVDAVLGQLLVGEGDRPRHRLARVGVLLRPLPSPVLHVDHLDLRPALLELAQDAAVVAGVAVAVVLPLPRDDRGQVRRMLAGDAPLVAGVVGDPEHAHLPVAPLLRPRPLDALVEVVGLAGTARVHEARRPPRAPRVHAHDRVAVRHPALRVGGLPVLVLVGRPLQDLRVVGDHLLPLHRVAVLVREALGVDPVRQDDRVAALRDGAVDVGPEDEAVLHLDRLVPGDPHPVADLGARLDLGGLVHGSSPRSSQCRRRDATRRQHATVITAHRSCATRFVV